MVIKGQIKERKMGLACSQIRLLTLTSRKADLENNISIDSMKKMALAREQSELSKRYYSMLQGKQVSYYANGQENKINYNYLMGYGSRYEYLLDAKHAKPIKDNNKMLLADCKGRVVLSQTYANAITKVLGSSAIDVNGRGGTFSKDKIAEILASLFPTVSVNGAEDFQAAIDEEDLSSYYYDTDEKNTMALDLVNADSQADGSKRYSEQVKTIVDFYYPIFLAAAANGWTTEYNNEINTEEDYLSDSLISGTLQLAEVNSDGSYNPNTSLNYFLTSGAITAKSTAAIREQVAAWYNAEKDRLTEKESFIDLEIRDCSTELEAIKTEMESIKSFIKNSIETVFNWGNA